MLSHFAFDAELWLYPGKGGWHFVTLPPDVSDAIRAQFKTRQKPFGSVAVVASIGPARWQTSLFADTARNAYLLPVKADVRTRAGLSAGQQVIVALEVSQG